VQNSHFDTTYTFTLTLEDPLLQLGVPRMYSLQDKYMFYVEPNTVDASTTLEIHQKIVHKGTSSGTANSGLVLSPTTNCGFGVSPFNEMDDVASLVYSLTSSTAIKNTDAFFVGPTCGYAIVLAGKSGPLQSGNSFCVIMCAAGDPSCHACDGFTGVGPVGSSANQLTYSMVPVVSGLVLWGLLFCRR